MKTKKRTKKYSFNVEALAIVFPKSLTISVEKLFTVIPENFEFDVRKLKVAVVWYSLEGLDAPHGQKKTRNKKYLKWLRKLFRQKQTIIIMEKVKVRFD